MLYWYKSTNTDAVESALPPPLQSLVEVRVCDAEKGGGGAQCLANSRYSVYLLYWYKSTNTDVIARTRGVLLERCVYDVVAFGKAFNVTGITEIVQGLKQNEIEMDSYLLNTVMGAYSACGHPQLAIEVFNNFHIQYNASSSAYVSIRQHTSAYVSVRQHTSTTSTYNIIYNT